MTHHEKFSARHASEDGGPGHFDVIEQGGTYYVYEESYPHGAYDSLDHACVAAETLADAYDQRFEESHTTPKPGMTTDERKRGLRAAVAAKNLPHMVHETGQHVRYPYHELLWQIIDSLVEECAEYDDAMGKLRLYLDYPGNGIPAVGAGAGTVEVCLEVIDKVRRNVRPADKPEE